MSAPGTRALIIFANAAIRAASAVDLSFSLFGSNFPLAKPAFGCTTSAWVFDHKSGSLSKVKYFSGGSPRRWGSGGLAKIFFKGTRVRKPGSFFLFLVVRETF